MERSKVYELVDKARQKQTEKHGNMTPVNRMMDPLYKLAILTEEVGEVSREIQDGDEWSEKLKAELIDVAAVAIAWLESFE